MENEIISNIKRPITTKKFNSVAYLSELYNANGNELDPGIINSQHHETIHIDLHGQLNRNLQKKS